MLLDCLRPLTARPRVLASLAARRIHSCGLFGQPGLPRALLAISFVTVEGPLPLCSRRSGGQMDDQCLAVHRTIVALDVEGFGARQRTNRNQLAVRDGLYRALHEAFQRAGIPWDD